MCLYDRVLYESYDHDMESDNSEKKFGHYARELTLEEMQKLRNEKITINQFKQEKLEKEAAKNWDLFYKRNSSNFFKDRHWTVREFKELSEWNEDVLFRRTLLEIGCGAGNFIFPLIEENLNLFIHACDVSKRAVDLVKNHQLYDPSLCNAFCCDLTTDDLLSSLEAESIDIVSIIFVLSSIHPEKMEIVLKNVFKILKPGGQVLFRDYGLYDQAMLRFSSGHKLAENFYVRQDGTRAFYFSEEYLSTLFLNVGFEVISCQYIQRRTVNKKNGIDVPRIFIQGKFQKSHKGTERT